MGWLRELAAAACCAAFFSCYLWPEASAVNCAPPRPIRYELRDSIRLSQSLFVEGLIFDSEQLYASTGLYGRSAVYRIDPKSGEVALLTTLPAEVFGEGLDLWHDRFVELTWKENQVFEWGKDLGLPPRVSSYPWEGWGLTHDGGSWIASDGSSTLRFLDPATLRERRRIEVRTDSGPLEKLNELEFAEGAIYANIFQTDRVVKIDPASGCVLGELSVAELNSRFTPEERIGIASDPNSVANGIAYDAGTGEFYLGGKNWPLIFKVKLASDHHR